MVQPWRFQDLCVSLEAAGLLVPVDASDAAALVLPSHPLGRVFARASSWHLHVRVGRLNDLPPGWIRHAGAAAVFERPEFVEYEVPGAGIAVSFSTGRIAADDRDGASSPRKTPRLDHVGFDFDAAAAGLLDEARTTAAAMGWRTVVQGGPGRTVRCCFAEVAGKVWLYPAGDQHVPRFAVELACGEINRDCPDMGDDLRPEWPGTADQAGCCGGG